MTGTCPWCKQRSADVVGHLAEVHLLSRDEAQDAWDHRQEQP
jgi:hypothetical protein